MAYKKKTKEVKEVVATGSSSWGNGDDIGVGPTGSTINIPTVWIPHKESRDDFMNRVSVALLMEAVKDGKYKLGDLSQQCFNRASEMADLLGLE